MYLRAYLSNISAFSVYTEWSIYSITCVGSFFTKQKPASSADHHFDFIPYYLSRYLLQYYYCWWGSLCSVTNQYEWQWPQKEPFLNLKTLVLDLVMVLIWTENVFCYLTPSQLVKWLCWEIFSYGFVSIGLLIFLTTSDFQLCLHSVDEMWANTHKYMPH